MRSISDISIEFAHVYLPDLDERHAEMAARTARQWAMPIVEAYEQAGLTVSTVVMLDDYFVSLETDVTQYGSLLQQACEAAGVRIDHVAHEADCAESVALMHTRLAPWRDEGRSPRAIGSEWLSNGGRRPGGRHAIHLDVELYGGAPESGEAMWACPTLSAWWQLIRLGMLDDGSGGWAAPPRTQSRSDAPPLAARRTLTLLEPRFMEVEHAVRVILEHVRLPEAWRRRLGDHGQPVDSQEHLKRIAYMFVPADFAHQDRKVSPPPAGR